MVKAKKKKYGELGQCDFRSKGVRCKKKATHIDGSRHLCRQHYMDEPMMSRYTKFKPVSRKGLKQLQKM